MFAAFLLPILVPAIITMFIWALPGDPASIICPIETCGLEQNRILAKELHLDEGMWSFFSHWISQAIQGDFGRSNYYGLEVLSFQEGKVDLLSESIPNTSLLILFSLMIVSIASMLGSLNMPSKKWDPVIVMIGVIPVIVLALISGAVVEIAYPGAEFPNPKDWLKLIMGAVTLGFADAAFSGSLIGFRETFAREKNQRYVGISILRGESLFSNTFPNVANGLVGQYRARLLHILSGSVIVEVVVGISGVGDLLLRGTLNQDFSVVLAAAFIFSIFSALLLFFQAILECLIALHIRKAPSDIHMYEQQLEAT